MVKRGVCPSRQADRSLPGFKNLKRGRPLTPLTGCCKVARSDPCPYAPLVHRTQVAMLAAGLLASARFAREG